MSDQEIIYSTPAFLQNPSELQNTLRPGGTQRPGKIDGKEFSGPSHLIAVALGILCLLLIMIIIVLGTMFFQCNQQKHQQDDILQNHIMQNNNCLTKQHLANTTPASDILENKTVQWEKKPVSPLIEEKTCHRKKKISSKSLQHTGKLIEELWSCCGVNCYLFTTEKKNWMECKQTCQNKGLSLLKIDNEDELAFLQSQTYKNNYWIGLSFNEKESKWEWIDKGTPGIYVSIMSWTLGRGECAFLTSTRIANIDCSKTYNCICVKNNVVNDIH
ncbi:PREDICTED: natural killer cells antigen CD94 [Myotis brandtii]|uniref:natural killer cells antigen CD94 n=1 Tax=Myotis brandtii TaxID=109478 RepID=UPI0003BBB039|nr:PREDICTED: natural killer cells antigen CD94 [Myotis brandtii]